MGSISCPSEFQPSQSNPIACVVKCPSNKGYSTQIINGVPACVYTSMPSNYVTLEQVTGVYLATGQSEVGSYTNLQQNNVNAYNRFRDELNRFNSTFNVVQSKIDKNVKLQDLFNKLQDAENSRDTAPEAYQQARIAYYTELKGESWIDDEKRRIAASEVTPTIQEYISQKDDMKKRMNQQKKTIDLVNLVKDKLLTVEDELATSVNVFSKQIDRVKNQIQIERHKSVESSFKIYQWITLILNILLVIASIVAIVAVVQTIRSRSRSGVFTQQGQTS